jgi:prepilin-type N-terminal cleavage/methylation domain-containing protein
VSKSRFIAVARRGFTLIELLVVITIILLISAMFLGISPGDGGGLNGGQRIIASTIRSVRAMALMNRGAYSSGMTYNGRYRLLFLYDPTDPVNHLHQFVVAVGCVDSSNLGGADPTSITDTTKSPYVWFAPEQPSNLPNGVYFIPPKDFIPPNSTKTTINPPVDDSGAKQTLKPNQYSFIGPIADATTSNILDTTATNPPTMIFTPVNQPQALDADAGGKRWCYIELQSSGASNHLGKVVLILANAALRSDGKTAELDILNLNKFAIIAVRPNGDVVISNDSDDINPTKLTELK